MGFFDRIGRELNKGIGAVGGFLGDVIGGAVESFGDPGFQLPTTGGLARKIGGLIGEAGEVLLPMPRTGISLPLPPTVPGGYPGVPTPLPQPGGTARLPVPQVPRSGGTYPGTIPIPGIVDPAIYDPALRAQRAEQVFEFLGGPEEVSPMAQAVALPGGALIG